jgi:Protein of unknown function (DUF2946)
MTRLRRNRWIAWITLAAVLFGVASLAHPGLKRKALPDLLADICSTSTVLASAAGDAPATPAPEGAGHHDHCWFCGKADAAPALLDSRIAFILFIRAAEPPQRDAPQTAAPSPALLSPPSRAPPRHA